MEICDLSCEARHGDPTVGLNVVCGEFIKRSGGIVEF